MEVLENAMELVSGLAIFQSTTVAVLGMVSLLYLYRRLATPNQGSQLKAGEALPPHIPSSIPFLGHAVAFGANPIQFLLEAKKKYGGVFSFTMVGKTFTYLIGSDSSALFFNSKNHDLNAEEVYSKLVTPVFGKGVAYDVPNKLFLEQKKMLKMGLTIAHFKRYIPLIEQEAIEYFDRWGDSGERDIFSALSELIILTASRCLQGHEIRQRLDEHVAQLYGDLDGGFSHLAWLLPGWLPLPSFKKRDKARKEMYQIFCEIIQKRRNSDQEREDDILDMLMHTTYKDGRMLRDEEIVGMLIGLLMAGQHTSSTTSAWLGFYLAKNKNMQNLVFEEQVMVCGEELPPLNYDQVVKLSNLDRCLKETLRLRPPIMTMMRMAKAPQKVGEFTIPPGHQVCVSPTVNQKLEEVWPNAEQFDPDRFLKDEASNSDKFSYVPFGAGRHRCIGENFAYIQIKTIWSVLLRKYEFNLVDGHFPPVNYATMIHTPVKPVIAYKLRSHS